MDLKEEYRKTGLSQQEFSELVGISRKTLNRYMKGETEPDVKTIGKIAKNLVEFHGKIGSDTKNGVSVTQKTGENGGNFVSLTQKTPQKHSKIVSVTQPKMTKSQTFEDFYVVLAENAKKVRPVSDKVLAQFLENDDETTSGGKVKKLIKVAYEGLNYAGKLGETYVFSYTVRGKDYDLMNLEEAVYEILGESKKQLQKSLSFFASDFIHVVLDAIGDSDPFSTIAEKEVDTVSLAVIDKFADFVDGMNTPGTLAFCLRYPILNRDRQLRKHLMLGYTSSSGKTIITTALAKLYWASYAMKGVRSKDDFNAGNWNADVADKYLTIIDDDGGGASDVDENFIKNFMSYTVPLDTARSKVRESKFYKGSSVLAVNTRPNVLKEPQHAKRVIFVNFDKKVTDVLKKGEIQHLYSLEASDWLVWLNKHQESSDKRFDIEKPVPDSVNSAEAKQAQELLEFILNYPDNVVPLKELKMIFDKNFIRKVIEFPPSHYRSKELQRTIYGYNKETLLAQEKEYKKTKK